MLIFLGLTRFTNKKIQKALLRKIGDQTPVLSLQDDGRPPCNPESSLSASLRHLVTTVSKWVDQVKFEVKFIPRYLTVCSRDRPPPLMRESGSWGEVFWGLKGHSTHLVLFMRSPWSTLQVTRRWRSSSSPSWSEHLLFVLQIISILQQSALTG